MKYCFSLRLLQTEVNRLNLLVVDSGSVDIAIVQCVLAALDEADELFMKYHGQQSTGSDLADLLIELKFYR